MPGLVDSWNGFFWNNPISPVIWIVLAFGLVALGIILLANALGGDRDRS